ncbi:unnamed protein product [Dibothriocephalus latus]|uniref:HRDC domain-containing protein n=1 Tax=Dibothriocephalus latus TaxID=60516 RepID=A0A3P6UKW4_DIBLA|nr:unnamed protein product [Dibothriocephalus latus]
MTDTEDTSSMEKSEVSLATDRLVSTLVPSVAKVVKLSHEFPSSATPAFTYYNDFPQYKAVMNGNANKILSLIQNIMDEVHGEGNILDTPQVKSFEEKFATIVDVNDRILDHVVKKSEKDASVRNAGGMPGSVKLLTAKNVSRPQVLFSRQPNNTATPFRPLLKKKPNAIVPLESSINTDNPESEDYPHPYLQELEAFANEIANKDYVIDTLALRDHLECLNEVFTDPAIVKLISFFAHRPLPQELLQYARSDTHYLLYIAEQLRGHLSDRGLLQSAMERSRELCLRIYQKPKFDPLGYLSLYKMSSGNSLNKRQLYALKQLHALRDSIARREDESLQYVLPNHMMKTIAEELPRETTGIFACCSPIPPLVRKYVYDIHKIILDARNNKLSDLVSQRTSKCAGL